MAITYPLTLPTSIGIANITLYANNAVAISQSPFTFQQQIIQHAGQRWTASVSIPPVRRDLAEPWNAFLLALKGPVGTFLLGDPNAKAPGGTALASKKNILFYTEQFDNAAWTKSRTTVNANAGVAPDGVTSADQLVETTGVGTHEITDVVTCSPSTPYVWSAYIKQVVGGTQRIRLRAADNVGFRNDVVFNFNTNQLVTPSSTKGFESVGNGWYRIWCIGTTDASASTVTLTVAQFQGDTSTLSYTGDGVSSVLLWGAQVEAGTAMTSYQPIADAYGPFVNGAGQTGNSLAIDGASPNESSYLKAGDYIQLGTGATARLHKVLSDVVTNDAGQATIDIWPDLRSSPTDGSAVIISNTVGRFRLSSNQQSFSIDSASIYGISFDCVEAL